MMQVSELERHKSECACTQVCVPTLNGKQGQPISVVDSASILASEIGGRCEWYSRASMSLVATILRNNCA